MRSAVIKRDDASAGQDSRRDTHETQSQQMQEQQRKLLRKELAEILDCSCEDVTLTRLQEILPDGQGDILAEKKEQLRTLGGQAEEGIFCHSFLLAECERFNRLMLNTIFNKQRAEVITYDAGGQQKGRVRRHL